MGAEKYYCFLTCWQDGARRRDSIVLGAPLLLKQGPDLEVLLWNLGLIWINRGTQLMEMLKLATYVSCRIKVSFY